jgi:hypothetical protein
MSTYLILKRGGRNVDAAGESQAVWFEVGEVEAGYPEKAIRETAEEHGEGDYFALSSFGRELFTVSSRKEYDVERAASVVEVAA